MVAFAALAVTAAVSIIFAMMMAMFLSDSGETTRAGARTIEICAKTILYTLAFGVLVPPVLLVCRVPTIYCFIAAGVGFAAAACGVLLVMVISKP